jgi:hypothetical protein
MVRVLISACVFCVVFAGQLTFDSFIPADLLHNYCNQGRTRELYFKGRSVVVGMRIVIVGSVVDRNRDSKGAYLDLRGSPSIGQPNGVIRVHMASSELDKLQSGQYQYEELIRPGEQLVAISGILLGLNMYQNVELSGGSILPWASVLLARSELGSNNAIQRPSSIHSSLGTQRSRTVTESGPTNERQPRSECVGLNQQITLHGLVVQHEGFRRWWSLKLDESVCIDAGKGIEEIQILDPSKGAVLRSLNQRRVTVVGPVVSGEGSPYYMTFYAIDADSIRTANGRLIVPNQPDLPTIPSRDLLTYTALFRTSINPPSIFTQARRIPEQMELIPSDGYVLYHVNGGEDFAVVGCADGFVISKINGNARLSPMDSRRELQREYGLSISTTEAISLTFTCRRE